MGTETNPQSPKIKIGDIVKAKFGSVVFGGPDGHFNLLPHGIVTRIEGKDIYVKIVFAAGLEVKHSEDDLEIIDSTNLIRKDHE